MIAVHDACKQILNRIIAAHPVLLEFVSLVEDVVNYFQKSWPDNQAPQIDKLKCIGMLRRLRLKMMHALYGDEEACNNIRAMFHQFHIKYLRCVVVRSGSLARKILLCNSPFVPNMIKQQLRYNKQIPLQQQHRKSFLSKLSHCKFDTLVLFHLDGSQCSPLEKTLYPCDIPSLDMFVDMLQKHLEQRMIHVTRNLDAVGQPNTMTVVVESQRLTSMWLQTSLGQDEQGWNKRFAALAQTPRVSFYYLQPEKDIDMYEDIPLALHNATPIRMFESMYPVVLHSIERLFFA